MAGLLDMLLAATLQGRGAPMGFPGVPPGAQPEQQTPQQPGGMLDLAKLFGPMGGAPAGFDALDSGAIPTDEAAAANDAREAAAGRVGRSVKRPPPVDTWGPQAPIPGIDAVAGMLSGRPPTNDPMSGEPKPDADVQQPDVPLPRPRPDNLGGEDAQASGAPGAPLSLAPQDNADRLPPNATPTEGRAAPAAAEPNFLESIGKKIFDPNKAATWLALGSGFAGAGSIGTGLRRASAAAVPAMAADRAQGQKQEGISAKYQSLYQQLLSKGVPAREAAQQALGAVYSPEQEKALIAKHFEAKPAEWKQTGTDFMGHPTYGWVDAAKQTVNGVKAGEAAVGGASALDGELGKIEPSYNESGRDQKFMDALKKKDKIVASEVEALVDGRANASGRNLQALLPLAARYEKDFTQQNYQTRQNLEKSYRGGGEGFRQLRAANTAITHGVMLNGAIDEMKNFDTLPVLNKGLNPIRGQVDKKYQDARSTFESNMEPFIREMDFALTGKSTVSGQNELRKLLDPDASGVVNHAALNRLMGLLKGRVEEHEHAYADGRKSNKLPLEALSAKNRSALDAMASGSAAPAGGGPKSLEPGQATTINGVTIKRLN